MKTPLSAIHLSPPCRTQHLQYNILVSSLQQPIGTPDRRLPSRKQRPFPTGCYLSVKCCMSWWWAIRLRIAEHAWPLSSLTVSRIQNDLDWISTLTGVTQRGKEISGCRTTNRASRTGIPQSQSELCTASRPSFARRSTPQQQWSKGRQTCISSCRFIDEILHVLHQYYDTVI